MSFVRSRINHSWTELSLNTIISPIVFLVTVLVEIRPISTLYTSTTSDLFLFYTSSSSSGSYRAGLYGGQVGEPSGVPDKIGGQPLGSMRQFGYDCYEHPGRDDARADRSYLNELRSISYDEHTGRVLLFSDKSSLNLVSVPACRHFKHQCANKSTDNIQVLLNKVTLSTTVKPGPFASHKAQLYFLLERTDRVVEAGGRRSSTIELRRIKSSCHGKFPVTPYTDTFDWLKCSEILATLSEEKNVRRLSYRPLDSILIHVPEDYQNVLDIYVQMQQLLPLDNEGDVNATILLFHARVPADEQAPSEQEKLSKNATIISRQSITSEHVKYLLYHLGGLSMNEGYLCWTAVEMILCARVQPGGDVRDVKHVIEKSDIPRVCTGADSLNTVVTGVVISEVSVDRLTLYFGCWSQTGGNADPQNSILSSFGGAGVAKVHFGSMTRVEKLKENLEGSKKGTAGVKDKDENENAVLGAKDKGENEKAVLASGMFLTQCKRQGAALAGVTSTASKLLLSHTSVFQNCFVIQASFFLLFALPRSTFWV